MKRLDILKAEKEKIKEMRCLSFSLIDKCIEWYDREIEAIEVHGAANDDYKDVAQADEVCDNDCEHCIWTECPKDGDDYKYIKEISKPTGIEFDEEQEQIDFVQPHKTIPCKIKVADGDLISKSKLVMYLNDWRFGVAPDETTNPNVRYKRQVTVDVIDEFMKIVEELPSVAIPSAEPQWTPVSERLPKEGEDVLACFYTGEGNYKMMVSRRSDYNYWNGVGRTADMVAWMPLPKPYEPQERSDKE